MSPDLCHRSGGDSMGLAGRSRPASLGSGGSWLHLLSLTAANDRRAAARVAGNLARREPTSQTETR
jgi:hypothetical protein